MPPVFDTPFRRKLRGAPGVRQLRSGGGGERLTRAAVAAGLTVFIGWYMADLGTDPGLGRPDVAAILWGALLAWVVVVQSALKLRLDLGDGYHATRSFETADRYRIVGVDLARRVLPNGDYANRVVRVFRPAYRVVTGRKAFRTWIATTRSKEASHLAHLILTVPLVALTIALGHVGSALTVVALDMALDVYPILVQRLNRVRARRILGRAVS